jgi:hypothetical protein
LWGSLGGVHFVSKTIPELREAIHQFGIRSHTWSGVAPPDKDFGLLACQRKLSGPVKGEDFVGVGKKAAKEDNFGAFSLAEK